MLNLSRVACLLALASTPALASTFLFTGTFTEDDNVALIPFSTSATGIVTIESFGYAGGITMDGSTILEGGFAPYAILFDGTGNEITSDSGGYCGITAADSVTGNCDDPYLQESLDPGNYTLALVEWGNNPNGLLADGFGQDGNAGFTCAEFGQTGNFCDTTTALGIQRNGNFAVQISGDSLVTPEPATLIPIAFAGALIAIRQRRKIQSIL
jgi:hypothetical protein